MHIHTRSKAAFTAYSGSKTRVLYQNDLDFLPTETLASNATVNRYVHYKFVGNDIDGVEHPFKPGARPVNCRATTDQGSLFKEPRG